MQSRFISFLLLLCSWGSMLFAQSGQSVDLSFTFEDDTRTYQLYVPADYDGSEAWPLVLNLHGFGANTGIQVFTSQMNEIADTAHFLVAYPQGLNTIGPDGSEGAGWNADWWTGRDDVGALSKLIDHAWTNYEIDLSRVYATGLDNGGQMSLALACALNDRIAAVGGVAVPFTQMQLDNCTLDRPVPALLMHGTADVLTPFNGVPGFIPSAPELAAAWAAKNNCDAEPAETMLPDINTEDSSSVILRVYDNCDEGVSVRFYEITGGGHTWSGGPPAPPGFEDLLGNVNRDVSSSVEMWDFFAQFTHPDPREGTVIEEGDVGLLQRTVIIDGVERRYSVYVPADYDGSEAWPLVINMHAFSGTANDQLTVSDMNPVADTAHFLVAYPQGLNRESLGDTGPGWNYELNPELGDDVGFIDALIDQVFGEFGIDLARVYATGLSQGGAMSYRLGRDLSDRIAAIAPVAASGSSEIEFVPERPLPFLQIHGTADGLALYAGREELGLISVPATLDAYVANNGCSTEAVSTELPDVNTMDNSTVTRIEYPGCAAGTEVIHYRVNDGGHTWPGGPTQPAFFGPTNQDFHASSEIWNFFNRHVHPDPAGVSQLLEKTITIDGLEREYLLYVPAAYNGSEEWPLVLNFHGFTSNPFQQIFASQMNLVADTADFLVAYPVGLPIDASDIEGEINPILPSEGPGWNVYGFLAEQDDLEFTKQIIQQTDSEFTLDNNRVYATGMSFGGIMTYYLACELNDQIAAFASVTGDIPKDQRFDCAPDKSVPILHIHGTEDPIAPYDGSLKGIGPEPTVQFWRDNNQCMTEPVVTPFDDIDTTDNSTVTLFEYDCADDSEVLFYRIDGGGHTWPGGPPAPPGFEFLGNVNMDINASSEIWNFFNRFTLPEETCTAQAGSLAPKSIPCVDDGLAFLEAEVVTTPTVPDGYQMAYVLTRGENLVIREVNDAPFFRIRDAGRYTIHTLVYDPGTLDLSMIELNQTTGFDVNALLVQGGGNICGALDVMGAVFETEECLVCDADAGTLKPLNRACLRFGRAYLQARRVKWPEIPSGYEMLFVLTSGEGLVIEDVFSAPFFAVSSPGYYTIHTLVYDPATLDLDIIEFGTTTGFELNALLAQGGGSICGALDVAGASFQVGSGCSSIWTSTRVYPNPVSDQLVIEFTESLPAGSVSVELLDLTGRRLHTQKLARNVQKTEVDVRDLRAGIYLLRVLANGQDLGMLQVTKME